jgi:hypothetical protein
MVIRDYTNIEKRFKSYKDFQDHLYTIGSETTTEEELDRLYGTNVTITFDNRTIDIPFDAVIYNELVDLMETIIKEF